jgi:hypothetical protein
MSRFGSVGEGLSMPWLNRSWAAYIEHHNRQDRVDSGLEAGTTTAESAKLKAAKKKIAALEAELAVHCRAAELLNEATSPKAGGRSSR